jgi:predicted Zn finger-like uncharacterized protein
MNVTCPNCATIYRVDPAKVPEAGVRARCAVCSAVFAVQREGGPARPSASAPTAAPAPAPGPAPAASGVSAPAHAAATPTPAPPPREHIPEPPRRIEPVAEPAPPHPPKLEPSRAEPPRPAAPSAPKAPPMPPPAMPGGGPSRPAAPQPTAPRPTAPTAPSPSMAAPSAAPRATAPAAPARPVNPFLSQDPALKARRLARALISDMVVYHPAKRQEGLRDGNLKELFEEEIKKSWEEYADQVGRDVADTTNYFREALNEILAGGRQIF